MPLIEFIGRSGLELGAQIVATLLFPEPTDRAKRKWLADGLRRMRVGAEARRLAEEGHESAGLHGLIALESPYDRPADAGTVRTLLAARQSDLSLAAHITAVLHIAVEADPSRATLKLARESWRLLNPDDALKDRALRNTWSTMRAAGPLALAYCGIELKGKAFGKASSSFDPLPYQNLLALTDEIAKQLMGIRTRANTPLFAADLFWRPPPEFIRNIKVEAELPFRRALLDSVLAGKVDPIEALDRITALMPTA